MVQLNCPTVPNTNTSGSNYTSESRWDKTPKVKGQRSDFCLRLPIRFPQICFNVAPSTSSCFTLVILHRNRENQSRFNCREWGEKRRRRKRRQEGVLKECVATRWPRVMSATKSIYIPSHCRSTAPAEEDYYRHTPTRPHLLPLWKEIFGPWTPIQFVTCVSLLHTQTNTRYDHIWFIWIRLMIQTQLFLWEHLRFAL